MLTRSYPSPRGTDDLLQNCAGLRSGCHLGGSQKPSELALDHLGHQPRHRGCAQYFLGLTLELRLSQPYGHDGCHALQHVFLQHFIAVLQQSSVVENVHERLGQSALEASYMGATLWRRDDVDVRLSACLIASTPANSNVYLEVTLDVGWLHVARIVQHGDGLGKSIGAAKADHIGDGLVGRQEFAELRDPALVQIGLLNDVWRTGVSNVERESGYQEAGLPGSVLEFSKPQLSIMKEDLSVGPVRRPGSGRTLRHSTDLAKPASRHELRSRPGPLETPGYSP